MLAAIVIVLLTSLIAGIIKAVMSSGKSRQTANLPHQTGIIMQFQMPFGTNDLPMFVSKNGQQLGPYPPEQVLTMLNSGMLMPFDMAIKQGEQQWQPLQMFFSPMQNQLPANFAANTGNN